ncbi:MAG: porin family protein, partial [Alphaproteobacteria bacterium]|nr:porin family protein [Alphaproteobacteria bacterium]
MLATSKKTIATLSFAAAMTASAIAYAGDATGPYVGAGLGWLDVEGTTVNDTTSRSVKFDDDKMGALFLGYDYGNAWRTELELSRRGGADLSTVSGTAATGDVSATSLMANVAYDFDLGLPVTPYLGAGLGLSRVDMSNARPFGASSIDDTDNALGLQGIAGLSYAINDNLDAFADYRYFTARNVDLNTRAGANASFDLDTHAVMVGLRYTFGAPKAAPVAAAAPAEPVAPPQPAAPQHPRTYLVFFDWDKSDITPEADAIIKSA